MAGVFAYANPPVIRWGAGSLSELGAEVARLGGGSVGVVTTRSLGASESLTERLHSALAPNPRLVTVIIGQHAPIGEIERATEQMLDAEIELLVSVGGGSPIDAAKLVAAGVAGRRGLKWPMPHIAVPTTLSVAELASGAGFTDDEGNKVGRRDPRMLPDVVVYDGELALATPMELWLSTGIRALDHAVEGYLARGEHPFSDVLALEAVRRLFATLPEARAHPDDPDVRTRNQLAAWFGYTLPGPTAGGLGHMMGKQIGARYGIPHGVTSCLLMPHVMRYMARHQPERLGALSEATGSGGGALAAADDVECLISSLGLPRHISAYGIGRPELRAAAEALAGEHAADDLMAIYEAAL
jgi:maleylacetate reductase